MSDLIDRQAAIETADFECGEWRGLAGTIINGLKNLPAANRWIPCKERLPQEKDSIFARFYGTPKWNKSIFRKRSQKVLVTVVYPNGKRGVDVNHTTDGEWYKDPLSEAWDVKTVAWMPLPEPYTKEEEDG